MRQHDQCRIGINNQSFEPARHNLAVAPDDTRCRNFAS